MTINLRMMLQRVQCDLGARQQHGAVIHEGLHQRAIFLRRISAATFAIHINRKSNIAKRRQLFRLHARKIILTRPCVKYQHARARRCHGTIKCGVALEFHLRIGVGNTFCLHIFNINARKKARLFKVVHSHLYCVFASRTSRARGAMQ